MKGISTTLVIIVTAIVLLVAAIVVLTIFSEAIWPIVDITTQRSLCAEQYSVICAGTGGDPPDWHVAKRVKIEGKIESRTCAELITCSCKDNVATCSIE